MVQGIIVGVLFAGAVFYIVRNLIRQSKAKSSCGGGTCKCEPNSNQTTN